MKNVQMKRNYPPKNCFFSNVLQCTSLQRIREEKREERRRRELEKKRQREEEKRKRREEERRKRKEAEKQKKLSDKDIKIKVTLSLKIIFILIYSCSLDGTVTCSFPVLSAYPAPEEE